MPDIALIKIGGSLLTDKRRPGSLRRSILARLGGEIAAVAAGRLRLVLGHGSGSFGHAAAKHHGLHPGPCTRRQVPGVAETQDLAARLHRHVIAALRHAGGLPFSLAPSSFLIADGGRAASVQIETFERAFRLGLLPVTYGDVCLDRRWGACICSTEMVLTAVARRLRRRGFRIRRAVWLGATAGVYDRAGRTIDRIRAGGIERMVAEIEDAEGIDVTGGMKLRLRTAATLARLGIPSSIVDGRTPGALAEALAGRPAGTRVTT